MQYGDFYELKEIGVGGYAAVYTSEYKGGRYNDTGMYIPNTVLLKRVKSFDETPELFINEVSYNNNWHIN